MRSIGQLFSPLILCFHLQRQRRRVVSSSRISGSRPRLPASVTLLAGPNRCDAESTGCILVRLGAISYIELVHPQDFISAQVVSADEESGFSINRTVFDCTLEKGVIVRARLFGLCVPRDNDVTLLREAYQSFLRRELPLTT